MAFITTSEMGNMVCHPILTVPTRFLRVSFLITEEDERDEPTRNLRYLVKWQNYSHIHNTWETYEYLKRFKGFKRVENYIKSAWQLQQNVLNNPLTSREDLEALEIEKERQQDQLEGYKQVERIIAQRDAPANADVDHEHC